MKLDLKTAILWVLQATLILVPLTWTSSTSELFEFPKMLLTYVGATLIATLWLARMLQEKRVIFRRTPFEFPLLLFLLAQTISTLVSVNPHTSLFGYYSRFNGGLLSFFSYALIYFAAVSNFNHKDTPTILKTLAFTALVSCLYAIPEHFGHSPSCLIISGEFHAKCWVQNVQHRIFGTFGQPNWLAAYLVAILPLTLFTSIYTKETNKRLIYALFTFLNLMAIYYTKSQSGLGATAIVLLMSFLIVSIHQRKAWLILALIPLTALIITFKKPAVLKTWDSLQYINPFYSTTANVVTKDNTARNGGSDSMVVRRIVWEGAWKLALAHPLFGTGVETFAYTYYNVRPTEHNLLSEWDFLYNKAHNEFLNFAANTGFFGLGSYILFLISYLWWSFKSSKNSSIPLNYALATGFSGLTVSNFFGFSTVPVNTLLFLFPAVAILLTQTGDPLPAGRQNVVAHTPKKSSQNVLLYWVLGIFCAIILYRISVGYTADVTFNSGKSAADSQNFSTAAKQLQSTVQLVPDEPLYTDELSLTASTVAASLFAGGKIPEASQAATIAIGLSNRSLELNPHHLNFYKTRARMFVNLSTIDPRFGVEAGVTLDKAIKLAPTDAKLWFNRALLTYQLGFKEESLGIFEKTLALKPDYETARYQYGQVLASLDRKSAARDQYQYILDHLNPHSETVKTALADLAK